MSSDDTTDADDESDAADSPREELRRTRERLEESADRAVDEFDQSIVDLLSWLLDTETRARIYVYLRQNPLSTSQEIAEGTGLYPSTVREALAELADEDVVRREKRSSSGAGNNPYEYEAIAPSDLVSGVVEQVQEELNTVFTLDRRLGRSEAEKEDSGPVRITVESDEDDSAGDGTGARDPEDGEPTSADGEDPGDDGADTDDDG